MLDVSSLASAEHLFEIARSAAGFLLALGINGLYSRFKAKRTFLLMLHALGVEAKGNYGILVASWKEFGETGLVFKQFQIATAQGLLADPFFLRFLEKSYIDIVSDYVTLLNLQNNYGKAIVDLEFGDSKSAKEEWLPGLRDQAKEKIEAMTQLISTVEGMGAGFVVMKRPRAIGTAAIGRGFEC